MRVDSPKRKKHSFVQNLAAPPARVFPLLCPVAEEKWVPDWNPVAVYSRSGCIEKDCIFITETDDSSSVWVVTGHDPQHFVLEMYKVTPNHTVGRLEIRLTPESTAATRAVVSYEFTAIGPEGVKFLNEFTREWYQGFMKRWEDALNHFLKYGEKINV